ncbi:uncharacterized protein LOC123541191 isoform X2 [Mercenaria mercenaria]|nr:uncharacterized protein LOC123541191 isoform X2 [Mercenaria mercenaria]
MRKTYGGLWIKRDTIELQRVNSSQDQWDESWKSVHGSPLDTDDVTAVKGTLIPGLVFLFVSLFSSFSVCCCSNKNHAHLRTKITCGTIFSTFISVVLITTGPILYATKIIKGYDFDKKQLDVGFWFAVVSAISAGLACCLTVASYISYRRKKEKRSSSTATRRQTDNGLEKF